MRNIAKRHQFILERLKKEGYVKVQELSEDLGVSEVTIRKDLKELEDRKMLYRNHGSASSITSILSERHIDEKEKIQIDEKRRISQAATSLLEEKDKIIIASGTTLLSFAREISFDKQITVITPSVKVSLALCNNPNIEIIQLGGVVRKSSVSVTGYYAEELLSDLVCSKLFLGIDGLDLDYGLTTSNIGEAHINQYMISVAQKIVVLADSTKFNKKGFCKICDIDRIDQIITDSKAPKSMIEVLEDRGIKVTLV